MKLGAFVTIAILGALSFVASTLTIQPAFADDASPTPTPQEGSAGAVVVQPGGQAQAHMDDEPVGLSPEQIATLEAALNNTKLRSAPAGVGGGPQVDVQAEWTATPEPVLPTYATAVVGSAEELTGDALATQEAALAGTKLGGPESAPPTANQTQSSGGRMIAGTLLGIATIGVVIGLIAWMVQRKRKVNT